MKPTEPLALYHSWPLADLAQRFDHGHVHESDSIAWTVPDDGRRGGRIMGRWAYDFAANALTWSREVYRLFGLPSDLPVTRVASLACYAEQSRVAMERLRAHAIRHRRGFTLDIEISPIGERNRWLRLVAAPVSEDGRVVRLHGYKVDVTDLYA